MKTLLEKATERRNRKPVPFRHYSQEHVDLAFAWMKDEITLTDVCFALEVNVSGSVAYSKLAQILRYAYRTNKIKLNK